MHVQNEELTKELKHAHFENHRKAGKIYKISEAETANDHVQENKARQIHRQVTLKFKKGNNFDMFVHVNISCTLILISVT